ncbi:uncharacterized protein LOC132202262 [Neocloeon triangulifer]|uniref:uncharacterized protein LOC132202262 n=1 Tax=Neocloeon triangulifer TaxID=2078957 RepID=UPI00286F35C0|nr:uncharacterized protein LOC132202262 [Neocloeon triangulifer]XP_059485045.1 uncharacterized protein LOC132202262 [Neocloeon triangulifer]
MKWIFVASIAVLVYQISAADGEELEVNPDFRSVTLQWGSDPEIAGKIESVERVGKVLISYCELQTWGTQRCREKAVKATRAGRMFTAQLSGLRMATKYTFRLIPDPEEARTMQDEIPLPSDSVTAQTKGFSAKATQCLANSTEVEVDTGPYFGGRISVESLGGQPGEISPASEDESSSCSVWGNPRSPQSTYKLRFDHNICGGTKALNESAVATFLLVQENLPILTHSTRRFLVLCTAQPDTLTVSAGISLPGGVQSHAQGDNSVGTGEAEPQWRGARLLRNPAIPPALMRHSSALQAQIQLPYQARLSGSSGAQLVLMLALVSTVAIGSGFAAWWVVRRHRQITAANAIARRNLDACSATAVSMSRSTSFTNDDLDDLSISSYDQFATRRSINSELSEASSAIRGDTTSCSSLDTDTSSGSLTSHLYGSSSNQQSPIYSVVIRNVDDQSSDA